MSAYLLLELVLRPRAPGTPTSSAGYQLVGVYAVEMDAELRRLRSHRFALRSEGHPTAEAFDSEVQILARVLAQIEQSDCLVTTRGRQLEVPVLETLALRYGLTLRGHFPLQEPYSARRSPYNPAGHLDLSFFLSDGDRRLKGLGPELLVPLALPGLPRPAPRDLGADDLDGARRRALFGYLLFVRVQQLRGLLTAVDAQQRRQELHAGLSAEEIVLVEQGEWPAPAPPAPSWLDSTDGGVLAFDIETAIDTEALGRCVGREVTPETATQALVELFGPGTEFAPLPFHRVVALAMVHWTAEGTGPDDIELERLVLGDRTRLGAPIGEEATLLSTFWRLGKGKRLLSYNGKRFDLPVLLYRSLPHGLDCSWYLEQRQPAYEQYRHPQSIRQLDVFEQLSGGLSPGRLGDLLRTVGLPGKQGTNGADVESLWAQRDLETLGDYCLSDAAQTFLLALRFMSVSGQIERSLAGAAIAQARSRFEREPALSKMVAASAAFFEERA